MKRTRIAAIIMAGAFALTANAQKVDFSSVSVPEESGIDFVRITQNGDYVYMPKVKRSSKGATWDPNYILAISKDGSDIAYLSTRNKTTNIFIKSLIKQGSSIQRTTRQNVVDFTYSPDGEYICFSERRGKNTHIFQTSSTKGFVCRQFTGDSQDFAPIYSNDMSQILFTRQENKSSTIWSYNIKNNFLSTYTKGLCPYPANEKDTYYCTRINNEGRGEIWRINYETGIEECIISDHERSFSSPRLSPCGQWMLLTGSSKMVNGKSVYWNTDIYVARLDGTSISQLTFHGADDLCPVWSKDGNFIYFISQRGNAEKFANIWSMPFIPPTE